jgi:nanoRNase/pAp phosphatase (c-di-AMP/oligoRNAs hydrolase)
MDGFASAWTFQYWKEKYYGHIQYIPAKYEEDPLDTLSSVEDRLNTEIYILDFSFSKFHLRWMSEEFKTIYLYDHHKTASEELGNWYLEDQPKNVHIIIDQNCSGAGLCWYIFSEYYSVSKLIDYVQDRDLWKFSLPNCKEITEVIKLTPTTFSDYIQLHLQLNTNFEELVAAGTYLRKQTNKIVEELAKLARSGYFGSITGETLNIAVVNAPSQFSSDLGNYLCSTRPIDFAVSFYISENGKYHYSLRSLKEGSNVDVSEIARIYGGGGHRNAAGFVSDYELDWN